MSVRLTASPLSVSAAAAELFAAECGGVVLFVGRVRPDRTRKGVVGALFYEADRRVGVPALKRLERTGRTRFGARRVVLWHRVGTLTVGTPSVIIGVAAPHRLAAFSATRYLIHAVKERVPIWKTDRVRPVRGRPPRRHRRGAP